MTKLLNRIAIFLFVLCIIPPVSAWSEEQGQKVHTSHGLSLFGDLKYGPDFRHFDYVNPDAPKEGTYTYAQFGTFDSLNAYTLLGTAPALIVRFHETLMERSYDEPTSLYGHIAESVTLPEDNSWVEFKLRDIARWHDGRPITVEDVIFTFETLKAHGRPEYRNTYERIDNAEKTGPRSVRFNFIEKGNRSLSHNLALFMWVFPKHYYEGRDFTKPSLDPPLSSTPYKIYEVDSGRSISLERVNGTGDGYKYITKS
jgi:microcin C transport system substrate-binding protein